MKVLFLSIKLKIYLSLDNMDLTINNLIKIILGVFVFVIVVGGIYFFFKNYVLDFFENFSFNETSKLFLSII